MAYKSTHRVVRRVPCDLPDDFPDDMHPLLAQVMANRGVKSATELQHSLDLLLPFQFLKGMDTAVSILAEALEQGWKILVVGDFDADGATSTALAVKALRQMGAAEVDFLVPNRFEFGYGLTPEIVAVAVERRPDLIITVDNGIASIQGVTAAQAHGLKVLVTDHHLPGETLPAAEAIVNPNQPGDKFSSKNLAGVGVIFYTMLALRSRLRQSGWFRRQGFSEPNLATLLDLVALGTVADVVSLDHNNRILVAQGLARIRAGQACPGILALCEVARRTPQNLMVADLGFAIGPRLNAAGRMDDMSIGIHCLLSESEVEAHRFAQELDQLNRERRAVEGSMREEALAEVQRLQLDDLTMPFGLCLYNQDWHEGVIGILASRIKERVHRPVIVFTDTGDGIIKGSARSVPGVHIRDTLDAVASSHPDLLDKFGGHAMAAGLSLARDNLEDFKLAFDAEVRRHLSADDLQGILVSDGELPAAVADLTLAETLRRAVPWGQGFPEPLFDGRFEVVNQRTVGKCHLKMLLRWPDENKMIDAIAFHVGDELLQGCMHEVELVYRLGVNEWQGNKSVQLLVEAINAVQLR